MIFYILGGVLIALFLFFLLFGYFCFSTANVRRKSYPADRRAHGGGSAAPSHGEAVFADALAWFDTQKFETASVTSFDGLRLVGQLLPVQGRAKGIVIGFHGYHSSCRRDLVVQAKALHEAGYHLLLVSQRSHGASEGKYICFGANERHDVAPWCELAIKRFGSLPIALLGLSMGAATVLMASELSLPSEVCAVVADCGFTTPWEIIRRTLRRKHKIVPFPVIYFMNFWSRLLAKFDYHAVSTEQALKKTALPILLIHGSEDLYVPCTMSERNALAAKEKAEFFVAKGARHSQSVLFFPEEYLSRVLSFLEQHLK